MTVRLVNAGILSLLLLPGSVWAQVSPTATQNYVVEQTPRSAIASVDLSSPFSDVPATVSYFDGLGRPLQSVQVRGSANANNDLVTGATTYDAYGRVDQTFLPVPGNVGGTLLATPQAAGQAFYGDTNPFTQALYESSPLNRVTRQWGTGQNWRMANRSTNMQYGVAPSNTVLRFKVNFFANVIYANVEGDGGANWEYFGVNDIATQTTTNEQGNVTTDYIDLQGRVLRRDAKNGSQTLTTVYVYDVFNRLAGVIPPKLYDWFVASGPQTPLYFYQNGNASNPTPVFMHNCYVYRYDARSRLIRKHVAAAGWTDLVYDQQDRLVMSQDEQDRADGKWRYTRYDGLSRVVETGRLALTRTADQLRADFAGTTGEAFPTTVYPPESAQLTRQQYDDYADAGLNFVTANAFATHWPNAKSLLTRSLVRNLETNTWYESAFWYDDKERVVQQQSQHVRNGVDRIDMQYRFNGEVVQVRTQHETLTELTSYQYDHLGRKTSVDHSLNGATTQRLATYRYDAIGRLLGKDLGGSGSGSATPSYTNSQSLLPSTQQVAQQFIDFIPGTVVNENKATNGGHIWDFRIGNGGALHSQTYSWHIRGGLRGINLDGSGNPQTGKLFSLKLGYEEDGTYYDGNIRSQQWRTARDSQQRTYTYNYDGISRLTSAAYAGAGTENYGLSAIGYDANGNLTSLTRNGKKSDGNFGVIDNLSYSYADHSNHPQAVSDGSGQTASFSDAGGSTDYTYWPDGSLRSDANKAITLIEYNLLKRPRQVTFSGGQTITFQYDAVGNKLTQKDRAGVVTQYVGNQLYRGGTLQQLTHEEGRIVPSGTSFSYQWGLQDHVGNLRVMFSDSGGIAAVVQEEGFGPWGESLTELSYTRSNPSPDPYVFTGHERMSELGVYDAKARVYDPIVPRFWQPDPLAEAFHDNSPYQYAFSNPLMYADPGGDSTVPINQFDISHFDVKKDEVLINTVTVTAKRNNSSTGGGGSMVSGRDENNYTLSTGRPFWDTNDAWRLNLFVNPYKEEDPIGDRVDDALAFIDPYKGSTKGLFALGRLSGSLQRYLAARRIAQVVRTVGARLRNVNDVIANPSLLDGRSLQEVQNRLTGAKGWVEGTLGKGRSTGEGWTLRQLNSRGTNVTDLYIQYSPGSPRHYNGAPYWKVSSGKGGTQWFTAK